MFQKEKKNVGWGLLGASESTLKDPISPGKESLRSSPRRPWSFGWESVLSRGRGPLGSPADVVANLMAVLTRVTIAETL